ncbi:MAG: GGDEF domain-containing protein, partial [Cyanobium sp. ELA507]
PTRHSLPPETLLEGQQAVLEMVASGRALNQSLRAIAEFSERCLPEMMASILYYDPVDRCLRRGGYGRLPESFQEAVNGLVPGPKAGSCGTCAFRSTRVISEDVFTDPLWEDFHEFCRLYGIRSAWSSPLISPTDGSLLGVFGMYYPELRLPSVADLELVDHFTHLANLATERHRRDEERRRQAWEDALTGLGNRHLLQARAGEILEQCHQEGSPLCLAFLDLDHFKLFNDSFGHHLGDKLLQLVGRKLQEELQPFELLCRFGGDEFVVLIKATPDQARERLEELSRSLAAQPLEVEHAPARLTLSSGLVDCAIVNWDLAQAIVQADAAARRAKTTGRNRTVLVDGAQLDEVQARLQVAQQLDNATRYELINPHGQPIVDLRTGAPIGMEMLFRPSAGVLEGVSPQRCINVAEETGLIDAIGLRMLRSACTLLRHPRVANSAMVVNVNLSVHQLMREQLVEQAIGLIETEGVAANRICLEITESHWLDTDGPSRRVLTRLLDRGFLLALDDFGTGYASLVLLRAFPFNHVKVDRSFVQNLGETREASALCSAMLEMGRACGLQVTAEGVETEEQRRILTELGYIRGQGYLFARPQPEDSLPDLLREMLSNAQQES